MIQHVQEIASGQAVKTDTQADLELVGLLKWLYIYFDHKTGPCSTCHMNTCHPGIFHLRRDYELKMKQIKAT